MARIGYIELYVVGFGIWVDQQSSVYDYQLAHAG
jgi:hypothetical protein